MSSLSAPDRFHKTLGELLDNIGLIISDLSQNGLTTLTSLSVDAVRTYITSQDKIYLIDRFIKNSEPYWINIKKKDDDLFVKNSDMIFGEYANYEQFNSLKVIFTKNPQGQSLVDDETKDSVRLFLFALIKISIKYIFDSKNPTIEKINEDGKTRTKITYKNSSYSNVDVLNHAKIWDVKLFS